MIEHFLNKCLYCRDQSLLVLRLPTLLKSKDFVMIPKHGDSQTDVHDHFPHGRLWFQPLSLLR